MLKREPPVLIPPRSYWEEAFLFVFGLALGLVAGSTLACNVIEGAIPWKG